MPQLHRSAAAWAQGARCDAARWADWDETTEDGLACDAIFVVQAEGSGDEIGQGGPAEWSAADRTLTQHGSIAGVVDGYRLISPTVANYFESVALAGLLDGDFTLVLGGAWGAGWAGTNVLMRFDTYTSHLATDPGLRIVVWQSATYPHLYNYWNDGTYTRVDRTRAFNDGERYYIVVERIGTVVRVGVFAGAKPVNWSEAMGTITEEKGWTPDRVRIGTNPDAPVGFSYLVVSPHKLLEG